MAPPQPPSSPLAPDVAGAAQSANRARLCYNERLDQMELESTDGRVQAQFMVPPSLRDGDVLTPFRFTVNGGVRFYFFGRYSEPKDMAEFVLAGPSGYRYKLSLADGNSPYGWKVKKHGMTRVTVGKLNLSDRLLGFAVDKILTAIGKEPTADYMRDIAQADAFDNEEIIGVPMAIMRIGHKAAVMDAKEKCIGPWSFYGPSLPEAFCRCQLKIFIYSGHDVVSGMSSAASSANKAVMQSLGLMSASPLTKIQPTTTDQSAKPQTRRDKSEESHSQQENDRSVNVSIDADIELKPRNDQQKCGKRRTNKVKKNIVVSKSSAADICKTNAPSKHPSSPSAPAGSQTKRSAVTPPAPMLLGVKKTYAGYPSGDAGPASRSVSKPPPCRDPFLHRFLGPPTQRRA